MVVALAIGWQAGKQHQIVTKNVAQKGIYDKQSKNDYY